MKRIYKIEDAYSYTGGIDTIEDILSVVGGLVAILAVIYFIFIQ